jgi:hypothetical protein
MELQSAVRRRAPRANAEFTRAALTVTKPINRQIGGWQSRIALLEALGSHRPGEVPAEIRQQAIDLMQAVNAEQEAFADQVAALPQRVATESRIADTNRALSTVLEGIQRILGNGAIASR